MNHCKGCVASRVRMIGWRAFPVAKVGPNVRNLLALHLALHYFPNCTSPKIVCGKQKQTGHLKKETGATNPDSTFTLALFSIRPAQWGYVASQTSVMSVPSSHPQLHDIKIPLIKILQLISPPFQVRHFFQKLGILATKKTSTYFQPTKDVLSWWPGKLLALNSSYMFLPDLWLGRIWGPSPVNARSNVNIPIDIHTIYIYTYIIYIYIYVTIYIYIYIYINFTLNRYLNATNRQN